MNTGKNLILFTFLLFLTSTVFSAAVELEEGWNTFSVDSTLDESELISSNSCDFRPVQGTDNYFFIQDSEGDYSEVSTLYPWNAYYGWVSEACTLQTDSSEWSNTVDLSSGEWNLVRTPTNTDSFESDCSVSQGTLDYMYYMEYGGEIIGLEVSESLFSENRGIFVYPTEPCSITYSSQDNDDNVEERPIDNSYLEFNQASVESTIVSAEGDGLKIDFSFDRDSAVRNDISADLGVHIDESSSPVETLEVSDESGTQSLSVEWETLWDYLGDTQSDVSAQLVLKERTEGNYRWNRDTIDAGVFEIIRCSEFESNIEGDWEFSYDYDSEEHCLDEVNVEEASENNYDFLIKSNQGGVGGEVEIRRVFRDTEGSERLTVNLDRLEDSSQIRTSDIEVRHFEGGSDGEGWTTVFEDEVYDIDQETFNVDFTEALTGTHQYNIIELTVKNDNYSSNMDSLEIEGEFIFEGYPEDGPGTCRPGQTWCGDASGGGICIDEESYSPGLCY